MMRGNGGSDIFFTPADRTRFLLFVQEGIERYGHRVHAFCLMDNPVHLLIQVGTISLSKIMQSLGFRYTRFINHKRESVGHLFQGRFKSILIDADSYLLTLKETRVVLEGITIGGKSMREHFEAINHREAILYVEDLVRDAVPFSESVIRAIHQLILKNIDPDNAGRYRSENVVIAGAEHLPPDHLHVQAQMGELITRYRESDAHPLARAAQLHSQFVKIHPFIDGNGRTARLLMNLDLMRSGYLPLVIQAKDRKAITRRWIGHIHRVSMMIFLLW